MSSGFAAAGPSQLLDVDDRIPHSRYLTRRRSCLLRRRRYFGGSEILFRGDDFCVASTSSGLKNCLSTGICGRVCPSLRCYPLSGSAWATCNSTGPSHMCCCCSDTAPRISVIVVVASGAAPNGFFFDLATAWDPFVRCAFMWSGFCQLSQTSWIFPVPRDLLSLFGASFPCFFCVYLSWLGLPSAHLLLVLLPLSGNWLRIDEICCVLVTSRSLSTSSTFFGFFPCRASRRRSQWSDSCPQLKVSSTCAARALLVRLSLSSFFGRSGAMPPSLR